MIRILFVIASVVAMSASGIAAATAIAGSGVAGAKAPVVDPISRTTCGTIDFATGGLSVNGVSHENKTGTTTATSLRRRSLDSPTDRLAARTKVPVGLAHHQYDRQCTRSAHGPFSISPSVRSHGSGPPKRQGDPLLLRPCLELRHRWGEHIVTAAQARHRL